MGCGARGVERLLDEGSVDGGYPEEGSLPE